MGVSGRSYLVFMMYSKIENLKGKKKRKEKKRLVKGPINTEASASLREIQLEPSIMRFQYHGDGHVKKV